MKIIRLNFCILLTAFALSACSAVPAQKYFQELPEGFEVIKVDDLVWVPAVEFDGIEIATLYGNPAEEGFYVIRVKFSPGHMSAPHTHDQARYVSVISGTWWVGLSNDIADVQGLKAGGFMVHPAGGVHFDGSRDEETIVEIRGIGPVLTTNVPSIGSRD